MTNAPQMAKPWIQNLFPALTVRAVQRLMTTSTPRARREPATKREWMLIGEFDRLLQCRTVFAHTKSEARGMFKLQLGFDWLPLGSEVVQA